MTKVISGTGGPGATAALRFSDPERYARMLRHAHEDVIGGGNRAEIAVGIQESWRRSLALGISPDQHSPHHVREPAEVRALRREHPLSPAIPALTELLGDDSDGGRQLLIITNAAGEVLWRVGGRNALAQADSLEFTEGADWSESGIGTNAISEVLRTGSAGQLFSAEHLVRTHHDWACTAAPIRHPLTGELLGVLDVSGPLTTLTPDSLRMVRCAVRAAEEILGSRAAGARRTSASAGRTAAGAGRTAAGRGEHGTQGDGSGVGQGPAGAIAGIELLGETPAVVHSDGRRAPLTLRRAEILALLCSRQQGFSADELAYELYGETGTAANVRIEMHRLRAVLGSVISSNPYQLAGPVRAVVDANQVQAALRSGKAGEALARYRAPLLSRSTSGAVELLREELNAAVRTALLTDSSSAALSQWLASDMGAADTDAVAALERLVGADPQVAAFAARARRLDAALL